jgi:hypothetical protein
MSIIGSYRLASALENGTYASSAALTTALGTAKLAAEFQGIISNRELLRRIMSNAAAVPLVIDSTLGSTLLYSGDKDILCAVLPNCHEYMKAVVSTVARFSPLMTVPGMIDSIGKSDTALYCINYLAVAAVFRVFPLQFVKIPGDGIAPVIAMTDSTLYGTTIAVTATGVMVKRIGQTSFTKVAVGGGLFAPTDVASNTDGSYIVVVGTVGIYYSADGGFTWTLSTGTGSANFNRVIYGAGATGLHATLGGWVAAGVGVIYTCSDGIGAAWNTRTAQAGTTYKDIAYGGVNNFVAVGNGTSAQTIQYSSNATTWSTNTAAGLTTLHTVVYDTGTVYLMASDSDVLRIATQSGAAAAQTVASSNTVTGLVKTSAGFIASFDDTAAGIIVGTFSATGSSGWTQFSAPEGVTGLKLLVAHGRDVVLFSSDSATIGACIGTYTGAHVSKLYNYDGNMIPTATTSKPFILSSGAYFAGADGSVYCSNTARKVR